MRGSMKPFGVIVLGVVTWNVPSKPQKEIRNQFITWVEEEWTIVIDVPWKEQITTVGSSNWIGSSNWSTTSTCVAWWSGWHAWFAYTNGGAWWWCTYTNTYKLITRIASCTTCGFNVTII